MPLALQDHAVYWSAQGRGAILVEITDQLLNIFLVAGEGEYAVGPRRDGEESILIVDFDGAVLHGPFAAARRMGTAPDLDSRFAGRLFAVSVCEAL